MVFPGIGRQAWVSGSMGGGTGRSTDWSTYDGTEDTAWQQWHDATSTALGTDYQVINGYKNSANPAIDSGYMAIDNNGTQTMAKWLLDAQDPSSAQLQLGDFHDLGTNKVLMQSIGNNYILTSAKDNGSIVVFNNDLNDSGKVSGYFFQSGYDFESTGNWDFVAFQTTTMNGSTLGPPYNYTTGFWHSKADCLIWIWNRGGVFGKSHAVFLKGNYTNQGTNTHGRDGVNELITTPSQSPAYQQTGTGGANDYGDIYGAYNWDNFVPQIHFMRSHFESDTARPFNSFDNMGSGRQTDRLFISIKMWDDSESETENVFKMMLTDHYMFEGVGGYGGDGFGYNLHTEGSYRSNSDLRYYKATGRSVGNVNVDNTASMIKKKSLIQLYNDETGELGGNLYLTAIMDTTETASSQAYPTAHDNGAVAEMFVFDEVNDANIHSNNAVIVSSTNNSDSTNTTFDAEAACIGDLHGDYFAVGWRQGSDVYVSIFEHTQQTSTAPAIQRVVDTVSLGTVTNAGRMAIMRFGPGVALVTCGNYYKFIKVPK